LGIAGDIAIITVAALLGGLLAHRLRLPVLLGYIFAGILVGPNTGGPTVVHIEDVEVLADIGVALLLFTVGLEFPVERLAPVRRIALIGTPIQLLATIVFGFGLGRLLGWDWQSSLWFGCLSALSSTMVVLKLLADRGLMGTLSSRVMTAILIIQDLAVIPMLILLPAVGDLDQGLTKLGVALVSASFFVAAMFFLGSKFLPWLMARVASWRSRELFMITVMALGLGIGYASYRLGLSFAFGAFLAGMVLSRSEFSHQALSEIIPLRDLFTMLFFVSVGMMLEPAYLRQHWGVILFLVAAVFLGKTLIFSAITRVFGYVNIMPAAVGLSMFQVGEFAFVLARVGFQGKVLSADIYLTILSVAALTMALTPFTAGLAPPLYAWWRRRLGGKVRTSFDTPTEGLEDHVVLIGYGRIGRFLASALRGQGPRILVLEEHPDRARAARQSGYSVIAGDASSEVLLEAAGLERARLLILTIPDPLNSLLTLQRIRHLNSDLKVLARASCIEHMEELAHHGVEAAFVPELEAGLELLYESLVEIGLTAPDAQEMLHQVRLQHYAPMLREAEEVDQEGLLATSGCEVTTHAR
jgi:CPA2 family monovalent cation:H+ antiporter-2